MDVQYLKLVHIDLVNERYQEVHLMHARMLLSIRTKVGIVVEMVVAVVAVAVVVGLRVRGRVSWGDAHRKDDGHAEAGGLVVERMGADVRNLGLRRHQEQADQVAPRRRRRLLLPFSRVAPRHIVLGAHLEMGKRLGRRLVRVGRLLVTADGQCVLVEPRVHWRGHWTRLKVRSRAVCCGACDARTSLEGRKTRGRSNFFPARYSPRWSL